MRSSVAPGLESLSAYQARWLHRDLVAGLVLTALLAAMASTKILQGGLIMLVFGLATIPSLFAVRWLTGQIIARAWSRSLVSLMMMFFGFQFAMRGFASLGWVDHFMLGKVMFW